MKYIYAVCFLLLVCGCHKENDTPVVLPARTLLVYLGGDNNLDAETYDKLVQIKNGWEDGTDGNIIVYQDTPFKDRSEEHTSELQSRENLVCRLLLEKKKNK